MEVIDCETAAANKFDDGRVAISELAQRVVDVCTPQRFRARTAAGIAPLDTSVDAEELKNALGTIEQARKRRKAS